MNWTRPNDLRVQVQKLWDRGELLAALVGGESTFPRRLVLKVPTSTEMTDRFDDVRAGLRLDLLEEPPAYAGLEEAKADVVGMYGLKWLVDKGALPAARLPETHQPVPAAVAS